MGLDLFTFFIGVTSPTSPKNILLRGNLQQLYNAEQSLLSFEGQQMQGAAKIMEKLGSLTFQQIKHLITTVDCQPMFDGGILINVLGQLKVYPYNNR